MKLNNKQISKLQEFDWDIVKNKHGNVQYIKVFKEDGKIFNEVCEMLKIGATTSIELAVVATKEDTENHDSLSIN